MSGSVDLDALFERHWAAVDRELRASVPSPELSPLYEMLHHHMGWSDGDARASGKRLRPTMLLLAAEAVGGRVEPALPAAAAVELLHNFSLIHDDVQDRSHLRRHRPTVWSLWGTAQAINAGDAMHAVAARTALRCADQGASAEDAIAVASLLHECCLRLVEGQYLDLSFETRDEVSVDEYYAMIDGKSAALIATSLEIGALLGGDHAGRPHWHAFGMKLGRAFQVVDDVLGVWGLEAATGKPAADDVVKGKRALPFLLATAELSPEDASRLRAIYARTERDEAAVAQAVELIGRSGAREVATRAARRLLAEALDELGDTAVTDRGREELRALAATFVERDR